MKFNVSKKSLYPLLSSVSKIINSKNALSILNNFKLTLEGDILTVTASDGENFLEGQITVQEPEGEGCVCVEARKLADLLKEFPDVGLDISVDTDNSYEVKLHYAMGDFKIAGFDGSEFPLADSVNGQEEPLNFSLDMERIIKVTDYTSFAAGVEQLRPHIMGVYWDIKPDKVIFVSTDTRKLVRFIDETIKPGGETSFLLPVKSMTVLKTAFEHKGTLNVSVGERGIVFKSETFTFTSRFLKAPYPDYNRVIPENNPFHMTVNRGALQSSLRRVGACCEGTNGLVRFKFTPELLVLKATENQLNSSAEDSIPCSYDGRELVVGFSAPYVGEILSSINTSEVELAISDPSRPGVFSPGEQQADSNLVMVLMPMLVNEF